MFVIGLHVHRNFRTGEACKQASSLFTSLAVNPGIWQSLMEPMRLQKPAANPRATNEDEHICNYDGWPAHGEECLTTITGHIAHPFVKAFGFLAVFAHFRE